MLVRLFTFEQLAIAKVESPAFRELLIYLQPDLRGSIPSRRSLIRYISYAYKELLLTVGAALAVTKSQVNLSFDL
jgi:hypothetical protein